MGNLPTARFKLQEIVPADPGGERAGVLRKTADFPECAQNCAHKGGEG